MKSIFIAVMALLLLVSCSEHPKTTPAKKNKSLVSLVNPFIGTGGHGHTYPGATMPFGMMQLSPDTRLEGWDGASGYHYSDTYIYGFTHTHLSGTGISDYADVLLMPTTEVVFNNGINGKKGYRSKFSHDKEKAEPGYYKVLLEDTNIEVELTVSERSGVHKYQFPSSKNQIIVLDLEHRDPLLASKIKQTSRTEITGYRHSKSWASNQKLFYYIKFSHPLSVDLIARKQNLTNKKAVFQFDNPKNEPIYVKIGISAVDEEGAKKNLEAEIGDKTFDQVKDIAQSTWEKQLEKIVIESDNQDRKVNFYTALYHTMMAPNLYQDVDGRYRGMDQKIHTTKDFKNYTVFSLWDTYRAAHPLYTLIERKRTSDFVNTLLAKYDEGGILPMWELSANYTGTMIGYHAVPVIADAYLKGIKGFDAERAFKAMKHSANKDHLGLKSYKTLGFIPVEAESESVSKTLEYAYDDWTIAKMAQALKNEDDYETYIKRAQHYKNVFDPETRFMRGRFKNTWVTSFDPYEVNYNYTEANAWQYSFYVPHDVTGLIDLMGGKEILEAQLDTLFTANSQTSGRDMVDITGLIGQYAHGNEPSHHMAYLYNFVNKPYKTQEKVHQILTTLYKNDPDGIAGNEDCGQMSAWYVFSAMGFYPVTPGSNDYIIGSPLFDKATINLENGKNFTIKAFDLSDDNKYIDYVRLNGSRLHKTFITSKDILSGGILEFFMTDEPSDWGTDDDEAPTSAITDFKIVPVPFISKGDISFKENTEVTLGIAQLDTDIFYTLNDSVYTQYEQPFIISEPSTLKIYAEKEGEKSKTVATEFFKLDPNRTIVLHTDYAKNYSAGGPNALIDGIKGTKDHRTGLWQGYEGQDVLAIINLGEAQRLQNVSINVLQDQRSWIFYPTEVFCYISTDGRTFQFIAKQNLNASKRSEEVNLKTVTFDLKDKTATHIKVIAKKLDKLPQWHPGAKDNGKSWIFVDEISIASQPVVDSLQTTEN